MSSVHRVFSHAAFYLRMTNLSMVIGFILFLSFILYQRSLENSRSLRAKRKFTFWWVRYGNFQNWYFPYFVHVFNIIGKITHNISRIRATPTIVCHWSRDLPNVPRSAERSIIFGQCGVPLFEGGTGEGKMEPLFFLILDIFWPTICPCLVQIWMVRFCTVRTIF